MKFLMLLLALVMVFAVWVRVAPSDAMRWHKMREIEADRDLEGGMLRVVETGPDGLARLDKVARATARTSVLAGSVEEGMITYVTRTVAWGFPDYTTVRQTGDRLEIYARLRFGRKDFGVNKARVEGWLAALGQG
ncbi:MAG: hypothetical protein CSA70_01835 [Rhodobacterales bacterium]|nr:MAG: hypothetical protein CSA70_01835 [Rhodobacterales bacterium]